MIATCTEDWKDAGMKGALRKCKLSCVLCGRKDFDDSLDDPLADRMHQVPDSLPLQT